MKRERARERDEEREKESERYSVGEHARCNVLFAKASSTEKLLQVTHAVQRAL